MWSIGFRDLLSGQWVAFATSVSSSALPTRDLPPNLYRRPFEWGPGGRSAISAGSTPPRWVSGLREPGRTSVFPYECASFASIGMFGQDDAPR
jgi:hypothetical protein